jgi:ABC-type spermidine/putrescine transport system permease subunit II
MRRRSWVLTTVATLLLLFIYLPLLVVVLYGFNGGSNLSWPPQGFSLRWFRLIFGEQAFRSGLRVSATAALVTAAIAVAIGTAAAFAIARRSNRLTRWFESGSRLPVMLPPLFIGIALVAAMKTFAIDPSMLTIIAGRLRNYDMTVEQAARDLGATPRMVLRRITLPLIAPAIFGATVIAFAISFDEVLITNFTSGTTQTLPLFVLSRLHRTIDPSVNAVATILLLVPWVVVGLALLWQRRGSRRGAADAPAETLARAA